MVAGPHDQNILQLGGIRRAAQEDARRVIAGGGDIRDTVAIEVSYRNAVRAPADCVRLLPPKSTVAVAQEQTDGIVRLIGYSQISDAVSVEISYRDADRRIADRVLPLRLERAVAGTQEYTDGIVSLIDRKSTRLNSS